MTKMLSIVFECDNTDDSNAALLVFPGDRDEDIKIINGIVGDKAVQLYKTLIGEDQQ